MNEKLPVTVILRYENGEFRPDSLADKLRQDGFLQDVKEGDKISLMYEQVGDDGSHAQMNYFHKLCRVISEDTAQPMEDITTSQGVIRGVKSEVKIKAGLWITKTQLKSSADFSKADFQAAIQGAIQLGEDLGLNLYNL